MLEGSIIWEGGRVQQTYQLLPNGPSQLVSLFLPTSKIPYGIILGNQICAHKYPFRGVVNSNSLRLSHKSAQKSN